MKDGDSLPLANGCGVGCSCNKESQQPDYRSATVEVFVEQFSNALESYLNSLLGKEEKQHVEDLAANASAFAEAFMHITFNF